MVRGFNTHLYCTDKISRPKNHSIELNNTINQLDLIDTNKTLHPTSAEYTFFSEHSGTFSRIEHMLGHEMSLNKF